MTNNRILKQALLSWQNGMDGGDIVGKILSLRTGIPRPKQMSLWVERLEIFRAAAAYQRKELEAISMQPELTQLFEVLDVFKSKDVQLVDIMNCYYLLQMDELSLAALFACSQEYMKEQLHRGRALLKTASSQS